MPEIKHEFHVGDVIRIRQWDDMKAEYGLDHRGDIRCPGCFVKAMKEFCGREVTITNIYPSGTVILSDRLGGYTYNISMLEPIEDLSPETIPDFDIDLLLEMEG